MSQPISDTINAKRQIIEAAAIASPDNKPGQPATYWLSLACCLLTSPVKAERERGKQMVRDWRLDSQTKIDA